jgi:NADH-quinone oxidoreductase subunit N
MSISNFTPLALELAVFGLAMLVLLADLFLSSSEKRGLGAFTGTMLTLILAASFFVDIAGDSFNAAYVSDPFGLYMKRVLLLSGIIVSFGSVSFVDKRWPSRQGEHYILILFSLVGMLMLTGAKDLVVWIVAFELAGVPLYVLSGMSKEKRSTEGALKLYIIGAVSSAFTLYGFSLLWGLSGSTSFEQLSLVGPSPLFILGVLLVVAGIGFKIGAVPFHLWMADTYQGAPGPTVAFMSVAPKVALAAGLVRLFIGGLVGVSTAWITLMLVLAVVGIIQGNLSAMVQSDSRRMLALSGVGHTALLMLALATGGKLGIAAIAFYSFAYVVTNMGVFLGVSTVVESGRDGSIASFSGLSRVAPGLSLAMLLFLLSLGAIPFMIGFWAKLVLFWAAWTTGIVALQGVVILGAIMGVVGLFYYMRICRSLYMSEPENTQPVAIGPTGILAISICIAGVVIAGFYPSPFIDSAVAAATHLIGG